MKFYNTGVFISLFILLISCSENSSYKAPRFDEVGGLAGDILIKDVMCTHIKSLDIIDSLLILNCQNTLDNKIFYIYNKYTGVLIKTFGETGNGPGELPSFFDMSVDKEDKRIYAIGNRWNISYSIDSILKSSTYGYYKKIKGEDLDNSNFIGFYKDSTLFSICNFSPNRDYRIAILKSNGDIVSKYSFLPAISKIDEEDIRFRYLFYSYNSLGSLKPDASKIVLATTCGLNMEIFNISEAEIGLDTLRRYIKPKYLKTNPIRNDGIFEGIAALQSTNDYIYALWTKDTEKEYPKQIALFSWKGDAIRRFNLDINIMAFTVESDDSKVYVATKDGEGKINIMFYELNK